MAAGCGMVQVASKVRKRRYSRRLASARYPQIPVALPGAAGKRRQGPVSSDRTPVALRVAQDLRGIRRPRGRVSAAKPSACSVAGCGRRCAESTRGRPVFIALTKQKSPSKVGASHTRAAKRNKKHIKSYIKRNKKHIIKRTLRFKRPQKRQVHRTTVSKQFELRRWETWR